MQITILAYFPAQILNSVLAEADAVAGAAGRTPLVLDAPHAWDPFVLSGVEMPARWRLAGNAGTIAPSATRTRVYRFTPRDASATEVTSEMPASFRLRGVASIVVPVPGGRLHRPANSSSSAGFWIVVEAQ